MGLMNAWNKVTEDTISNCFRKTGFNNTTLENTCTEDEPFIVEAPDFVDFDDFGEDGFERYILADENLATSEILTDENIIEAVCPSILTLDGTNEDELEDEQGEPEEIVPYSSAIKSLELIEIYLSQNNVEDAESVSNNLRKM